MDSTASGPTTLYPTGRPRNGLTSMTIDRRSMCSAAWTWKTDSAFSVIAGYGVALQGCTKRTNFQARVLPRIGNGMLSKDAAPQQHAPVKGPEPLKTKPKFNPFDDDEPVHRSQPTLCPKMAEFLLTESFNLNPFPDYGQWDEEKAMLQTLKPRAMPQRASRRNATNDGPIIYQPRPISRRDYDATLRNILEFDFDATEDADDVNGAYHRAADVTQAPVAGQNSLGLDSDDADTDSDGYSSGDDYFDAPSYNSSTDTTPDKLEVLLKVSPFDVDRVTNMDAIPDTKGLGLHTPEFKPLPLKEGTTALDLLKAIQVGSDLPFRIESPPGEDFKPTPLKKNTTALDLLKAIQVGCNVPFSAPARAGKQQIGLAISQRAYHPTTLVDEPVSLSASGPSLVFPDIDEDDIDDDSIPGPLFA